MVIRKAHNLDMHVRIVPPQPRKTKTTDLSVVFVFRELGDKLYPIYFARPNKAFCLVAGAQKFDLFLYESNNAIVHYTYILQNKDKSLYAGYSSDLKQRIQDHSNGRGSKTTKNKIDRKLIYYEAYLDKEDAVGRENFLKVARAESI